MGRRTSYCAGTSLTKLPEIVANASWDGHGLTVMEKGHHLLRGRDDTGIVTNVATKYVFSLDTDGRLIVESTDTAEGRDSYPPRKRIYKRKSPLVAEDLTLRAASLDASRSARPPIFIAPK